MRLGQGHSNESEKIEPHGLGVDVLGPTVPFVVLI